MQKDNEKNPEIGKDGEKSPEMGKDSEKIPEMGKDESKKTSDKTAIKLAIPKDNKEAIIRHLTSEIESKSTNIMNFRTKISFTIFIGPFLLLGSIIVGTKGKVNLSLDETNASAIGILALIVFLLLGLMGAQIERQVWKRINKWRECIISLQEGEISKGDLEKLLVDQSIVDGMRKSYLAGFALMAIAFFVSAYLAAFVLKGSASNSLTLGAIDEQAVNVIPREHQINWQASGQIDTLILKQLEKAK